MLIFYVSDMSTLLWYNLWPLQLYPIFPYYLINYTILCKMYAYKIYLEILSVTLY